MMTQNFCHSLQILTVKAVRVGGLSEFVKKGESMTKIFFSDNVEWSSKNLWKMMSGNIKQQEVKDLVAYFRKKYIQVWNII